MIAIIDATSDMSVHVVVFARLHKTRGAAAHQELHVVPRGAEKDQTVHTGGSSLSGGVVSLGKHVLRLSYINIIVGI